MPNNLLQGLTVVPFVQSRWPADLVEKGPEGDILPAVAHSQVVSLTPDRALYSDPYPSKQKAPVWGPSKGKTQLSPSCAVPPPGGRRLVTFLGHQGPFLPYPKLLPPPLLLLGATGSHWSLLQNSRPHSHPWPYVTSRFKTTDYNPGAEGAQRHTEYGSLVVLLVARPQIWLQVPSFIFGTLGHRH